MRVLGGVAVAAVVALAAVGLSGDVPRTARLQDRVEELEGDLATLGKAHKRLESSQAGLAETVLKLQQQVAPLVPGDVRDVALRGGGTERWELSSGAAYVQFLRIEGDVPVFTVKNRGGTAEVALRAGESHVAVDDRGSELRVHTTAVHALERDRTGALANAKVSVTYEVRTP